MDILLGALSGIEDFLQRPLAQTILSPFTLSLVLAALLRLADRKGSGPGCRGAQAAGLGPIAAFLAAYVFIADLPGFPPVGAGQKIFYVAAIGAAIGFAADWIKVNQGGRRLLAALGVAVTVGWIALPRLETGEIGPLILCAGIVAGGWIAVARLNRIAEHGAAPSALLAAASVGAGIVALYGASGMLAQLCLVLAAGILGHFALNWPKPRYRFGATLLFGGGFTLIASISTMVLYSAARPSAIPFILLVFFVDAGLDRMRMAPHFGGGFRDNGLGPAILLGLALIPAAAAAFIAAFISTGLYFN